YVAGSAASERVEPRRLHSELPGAPLHGDRPLRVARERITRELDISVRSADTALRYVQWLLAVTSEEAFWLVASADDVPFRRPTRAETDLKARIGMVRQDLETRLSRRAPKSRGQRHVEVDDNGLTGTAKSVVDP